MSSTLGLNRQAPEATTQAYPLVVPNGVIVGESLNSGHIEDWEYQDQAQAEVDSGVTPPFRGAELVRQDSAADPTWAQLLAFLSADKTDQSIYIPNVYMCGDYARDVYNDAERSGIRAAYVAIRFTDRWHACNAFQTTDRGIVFIDCTGLEAGQCGPPNRDKIVSVNLGQDYVPQSLFLQPGWQTNWGDLGTILEVHIYW